MGQNSPFLIKKEMLGNTIDMNEMEPVARPLLPIFFVLDTSGSMTGQPISMLNHAMEEVINIVGNFAASNSDALLKIGVLQFSSGAKWIQPKGLEEFGDFIYKSSLPSCPLVRENLQIARSRLVTSV